jgi:hypothetical protein
VVKGAKKVIIGVGTGVTSNAVKKEIPTVLMIEFFDFLCTRLAIKKLNTSSGDAITNHITAMIKSFAMASIMI